MEQSFVDACPSVQTRRAAEHAPRHYINQNSSLFYFFNNFSMSITAAKWVRIDKQGTERAKPVRARVSFDGHVATTLPPISTRLHHRMARASNASASRSSISCNYPKTPSLRQSRRRAKPKSRGRNPPNHTASSHTTLPADGTSLLTHAGTAGIPACLARTLQQPKKRQK